MSINSRTYSSLDRQIGAVVGAIHSMTISVADLCTKRNALAQIHRLPLELFAYIMWLALPFPSDNAAPISIPFDNRSSYYTRISEYAMVSKQWRSLIHTIPSFWHVVDSRFPEALWRTALAKSQEHPLHVTFGYPRSLVYNYTGLPDDVDHLQPTSRFGTEVFAEVGRWDTALLRWTSTHTEGLDILQENEAPSLRDLTVEMVGRTWSVGDHSLDLFKGHAPRLRCLQLVGVRFNWSSPLCHNLVKLCLKHIVDLSVQRLLEALQRCPDLEVLDIAATFLSATSKPSASSAMVRPLLNHFSLESINGEAVQEITEAIQAPNCTGYFIEFDSYHDRSSPLLHFVLFDRLSGLLHSQIHRERLGIHLMGQGGSSIDITLGDSPWRSGSSEPSAWFGIKLASAGAVLLDWFVPTVQKLPRTPLVDLHLSDTPSDLNRTDVLELLQKICFLETLTLERTPDMEWILQALTEPALCPRLHTLNLWDCVLHSSHALLAMVESRTGPGTPSREPNSGKLVRVQNLDIRGPECSMDDNTFDAIKRLVGQGAVWKKPAPEDFMIMIPHPTGIDFPLQFGNWTGHVL